MLRRLSRAASLVGGVSRRLGVAEEAAEGKDWPAVGDEVQAKAASGPRPQ